VLSFPAKVYPHVCGGILTLKPQMSPHRGLSPRVRGHHGEGLHHFFDDRSIPTCAGASLPQLLQLLKRAVYPHVCGGIRLTVLTWPLP